jgi:DNA-binding transcriptional LysR family regulator
MNLRELEVFMAVVDAGGFTAAAERLRVAQPAISATIAKLERDVHALLFVRRRRRLTLSTEGAVLLRHARAITAQVAAARRELAALQSLDSGHLTIGAPGLVTSALLPPVVDQFMLRYPSIRLTIKIGGGEDIATRLLRGEFDIGLIADWRTPEGLSKRLLQVIPMVACVASTSALAFRKNLSWRQLLDQPLILFPHGYYQRARVEDAATRLGQSLDVKLETESVPLMLEAVRTNHGIATLLAIAAENVPGIQAIRLPSEANVPIAICRRQDGLVSRAAEVFEAFILDAIKQSKITKQRSSFPPFVASEPGES